MLITDKSLRDKFIRYLDLDNMAMHNYMFEDDDSWKISKNFLLDFFELDNNTSFHIVYKKVNEMLEKQSFSKNEIDFYKEFYNEILGLHRIPKQEYEIYVKKIKEATDKITKLDSEIQNKIVILDQQLEGKRDRIDEINKDIDKATKEFTDFSGLIEEKECITTEEILKLETDIKKHEYYIALLEEERKGILKNYDDEIIRRKALSNCTKLKTETLCSYEYEVSLIEKHEELFKPECDYSVNIKFYMETSKMIEKSNKYSRKLDAPTIEKMLNQHKYQTTKIEKIREKSVNDYLSFLKEYIEEEDIPKYILESTKGNHAISHRFPILKDAIQYFNRGEYLAFNNIVVIQIEGVFYDYCKELGLLPNDVKSFTLGTKLHQLVESIEFNPFPYFKFQFEFIRNRTAHGFLVGNDKAELLANETLLDLLYLVYDLKTNKNLPYIKPIEFLKRYNDEMNVHFRSGRFKTSHKDECLLDYLSGDYLDRDRYTEKIQWLLNPTFNKIYEFYGLTQVVNEVREHLGSHNFWQFICKRIVNKNSPFVNEQELEMWKNIIGKMIAYFKNKDNSEGVMNELGNIGKALKSLSNK
ncbi:hypothetical protein PDJ82_20405 [Bacillus cereus group sp. TH43LC]|uniref:hypothetical protein n=1 Tax=Bacillus cereus group TaxID=86661 RepID=UPI0022E7C09A|nr:MULTISPECIES: hypothetical protein [unclassified Bacillus cereus group]MDA1503942.1 hypothetical protein [Bacillus cereus group sp. TH43LC]MDA1790880.1 hypothetical protein [Bacillus cereus group sp. BY5-1LC]MDA1865780.1 hypothetical protein [Bacillus cereus group sp. BY128LC]